MYNLYLSPIRHYPGPKLWAISRIPWNYWNMKGRISWKLRELHDQYGPVVRISYDELSYTTSGAWRKIYTQRQPEFSKCLDGRGIAPPTVNGKYAMPTENQERHGRLRRAVNPAFSERALREQEGFLQTHSDNLLVQLGKQSRTGPVDMTWMYNLCAFDIVSGACLPQISTLGCGQHPNISRTRTN